MAARMDLPRLMTAHQAGVWRYLRALGCEPAQADDLTQETFLAVYEKPFDERGARETAAYLRTVARNLFLMWLRASGRQPALTHLDEIEPAWASFAGNDGGEERIHALRACIETLDERERRVIELRYRADAAREEIATKLGLSDGGVKNLLMRVRDVLRACVERRLRGER